MAKMAQAEYGLLQELLIDDLLNSRTPKSERERAAVREIKRLRECDKEYFNVVERCMTLEKERDEARAEVERLRKERDAAQWYPMQDQAEVERLREVAHAAHHLLCNTWRYTSPDDGEESGVMIYERALKDALKACRVDAPD